MTLRRSERGQLAGIEAIPFGVLVFVAGTLLVTNAWAVVTDRSTADTAAREYLRAYTHAPDHAAGLVAAESALRAVLDAHEVDRGRVVVEPPAQWRACTVATVRLRLEVPELHLPFVNGIGTTTVEVIHRDRLDAFRAGVPGDPGGAGACA